MPTADEQFVEKKSMINVRGRRKMEGGKGGKHEMIMQELVTSVCMATSCLDRNPSLTAPTTVDMISS